MRLPLMLGMFRLRSSLRSPVFRASVARQPTRRFSTSGSYDDDTIFALSSGRGVAGVAVVRISGSRACEALSSMLDAGRAKPASLPKPRLASLRTLRSPTTREVLDEAIVLRFVAPGSFTGEDVVELHCHGGAATVEGVLAALGSMQFARAAEAGEFTRRAFGAGKLGLTEVEGLADLLAAQTGAQRRQALSVMSGALEARYAGWREEIATCRASAEVVVDFGDDVEGDVSMDEASEINHDLRRRVGSLRAQLVAALNDAERGEAVRDGVRVVLAGAPNAGKSSLLNALAARPAAIVSDTAGTTRDVLEVALFSPERGVSFPEISRGSPSAVRSRARRRRMGGLPVRLFDTAGLRGEGESPDEVEREGIRRAGQAARDAHLVLFVVDVNEPTAASVDALSRLMRALATAERAPRLVLVANKLDLLGDSSAALDSARARLVESVGREFSDTVTHAPWVSTSATSADGVDALVLDLERRVLALFGDQDADGNDDYEAPAITRERHRRHVEKCVQALDTVLNTDLPPELYAEELRVAGVELGRVVGALDVEDVLDVLFRDFCIGK